MIQLIEQLICQPREEPECKYDREEQRDPECDDGPVSKKLVLLGMSSLPVLAFPEVSPNKYQRQK